MESGGLTALVLGVGGNVSQGILKALARASLDIRVVAGCTSPLSAGLYAADRSYVTPPADDPGFADWVEQTCHDERVDVVLSGVEPVLEALAPLADRLHDSTGARVIVSSPDTLAVGADKLATARWLEDQDLPFPRSADASHQSELDGLLDELGLPLIAKPRRGKGGQGVVTVRTAAELALIRGRSGLVVQELLGDAAAEYTVGCVCDANGELAGMLAMRRQLEAGTTYRAEAGEFSGVRAAAREIVGRLRIVGPLNIQLRVHEGVPVAFELNVRFSGTTPMRAHLGFNEVEASIRHFVLGEPLELPEVTDGLVLRYWNELYVPREAYGRLERDGRVDDPRSLGAQVEDWGRAE